MYTFHMEVLANAKQLPKDTKMKHYGRALKRNAAVLLAKGEYVVFFDDDDYRRYGY